MANHIRSTRLATQKANSVATAVCRLDTALGLLGREFVVLMLGNSRACLNQPGPPWMVLPASANSCNSAGCGVPSRVSKVVVGGDQARCVQEYWPPDPPRRAPPEGAYKRKTARIGLVLGKVHDLMPGVCSSICQAGLGADANTMASSSPANSATVAGV